MVSTLIRLFLGVVLGFLALPTCVDLLAEVIRSRDPAPTNPWAVGIGVALGLAQVLWRRPSDFALTWLHEHAHMVMAAALFVRVEGISATRKKGGELRFAKVGPIREGLILIAPYTLPLLLAPALGVRYAVDDGPWGEIFSGACALLFVFHVQAVAVNVTRNFTASGADLPRVGRFLALVLVTGCLLLVTSWTVATLWPKVVVQGIH